jgi:hypothetical protein
MNQIERQLMNRVPVIAVSAIRRLVAPHRCVTQVAKLTSLFSTVPAVRPDAEWCFQ